MRDEGLRFTDRDIDLLKYLAHGPAFSQDLHLRFFVKEGRPIARRVFARRMSKLVEAGCLQVLHHRRVYGREKDRHGPVYSIARGGVDALTQEGGINIDRIRLVDLGKRSLVHEIIQTRLVRKIYEHDGVHYRVIRLYDDVMLAKQAQRIKLSRIPDLRFTVQLRNGSYFSFLVEVDAGSTHAPEFIQKLVTFTHLNRLLAPLDSREPFAILIVCDTQDRMAYLQRAVMQSPLTSKIFSSFAFNTIYNLDNSLGLFNPWYKADGTKIERIFKESVRNPNIMKPTS